MNMKVQIKTRPLINWVLAIVIVVVVFYGLNHGVMSMQGLPLNVDLTPVQ
ncbi:MAG: hypothetical protein KAU21_20240 [Gammaproteobacteria bacterium]|nr:hypothetical protein [Gammaproteobacteria bacterium]